MHDYCCGGHRRRHRCAAPSRIPGPRVALRGRSGRRWTAPPDPRRKERLEWRSRGSCGSSLDLPSVHHCKSCHIPATWEQVLLTICAADEAFPLLTCPGHHSSGHTQKGIALQRTMRLQAPTRCLLFPKYVARAEALLAIPSSCSKFGVIGYTKN